MKIIVRTIPNNSERNNLVSKIVKELPMAEVQIDMNQNAMLSWLKALESVGEDSALLFEDDVHLANNFKEKAFAEISKREDTVIQFFSMRKDDIEIGSRLDYGSKFMMNQCTYYPKGYCKLIRKFYNDWHLKEEETKSKASGYDLLIADFLKSRKEYYYIVCPSLVDHAEFKSVINPRRSSKRQSKTFEAHND